MWQHKNIIEPSKVILSVDILHRQEVNFCKIFLHLMFDHNTRGNADDKTDNVAHEEIMNLDNKVVVIFSVINVLVKIRSFKNKMKGS